MEICLRTTGCRLPYGITQCYLPPDTPPLPQPVKAGTRFTYTKGWRAELTYKLVKNLFSFLWYSTEQWISDTV